MICQKPEPCECFEDIAEEFFDDNGYDLADIAILAGLLMIALAVISQV